MFKVHPEWFETPHPESNRGKNEVDYSNIEIQNHSKRVVLVS